MPFSLLISTASSREEAALIAEALVDKKLVACVNIVGPIDSIYRWKGAVEKTQEFLLLMKTSSDRFNAVRDELRSLHSYEVPELIELPIANGLPAYLDWLSESLG